MITGIAKPCGHKQFDKKTAKKNAKMFNELNRNITRIIQGK